jgi:hypothetical protein
VVYFAPCRLRLWLLNRCNLPIKADSSLCPSHFIHFTLLRMWDGGMKGECETKRAMEHAEGVAMYKTYMYGDSEHFMVIATGQDCNGD